MAESIRSLSSSPRIRRLPLFIATAAAFVGDFLQALGWRFVPLTSFRLKNIRTEYIFDLSPIESLSKFSYIDLDQGIKNTLEHLRVHKP